MTKITRFLSGQIVANNELQNKQDLPTVCRSLLFVQPTLWGFCQANSKAPKVEQVFLYATCNNHSWLLFCLWTDPLWSWRSSLEKLNCRGWCVVSSTVHKGVWVFGWRKFGWRKFPRTERVDKFSPCHPMCLAQWNDGKIILTSLRYQ